MPGTLPADPLLCAFGPGALYVNAFARRPEDGFHSPSPDETDDLFTALPLSMTRAGVRLLVDPRAVSDPVRRLLTEDLGLELCDPAWVEPLPEGLNAALGAAGWCEALIQVLAREAAPGALLMSQPFQDPRLEGLFRRPPALSQMLNDKLDLPTLVDGATPPTRLATLPDTDSMRSQPWPGVPCVIKLSGACAGEGVWAARDEAGWAAATTALAGLPGRVLVERWIEARRNLDVEFLIPHDPAEPCLVLGAVEQIVGPDLRLAGGVVAPARPSSALPAIEAILHERVMPRLRALGWHGIGGFDVLVDEDDRPWFIDPNLRLTDFTAPLLWRLRSGYAGSVLILPYTSFDGDLLAFRARVAPLARPGADRHLVVLAILDQGERLLLQAGLLFEGPEQLRARAATLRRLGLSARALELVEIVAAAEACR